MVLSVPSFDVLALVKQECSARADVKDDVLVKREMARLEKDRIEVCKWYDMLMKTEDDHRIYLEIVKRRAPEDDPRIKDLEQKKI